MIGVQIAVSVTGILAGAYCGLVLSHQVTYLVMKKLAFRNLDKKMPPAP